MNAWKAMKLSKKYANCLQCGSDSIGNGEGSLIIDDDTFIRSCKCGWKVEVKERQE